MSRLVKSTPFLVFALIALVVFWNFILYGETFYQVDFLTHLKPLYKAGIPKLQNVRYEEIFEFIYPFDALYNQSLKDGKFPLWDPYSFCGNPFFANPQVGMIYPPKLILHWLFDVDTAYGLFLMIHFFFAGACMYLLLRKIGLSISPSTFGGVVWMLCNCIMTRFKYTFVPVMGVYLPLVTLFIFRGLQKGKVFYFIIAGALLGINSLCQHPQYLFILFYFFAAAIYLYYAIEHLLKNKKFPIQLTWHFFIMFSIALGIYAIQLLPFLEAALNSNRIHILQMPSHPWRVLCMLVTIVFPRIFGSPIDKADFTNLFVTHYAEYQAYIGFISLFFILVFIKFEKITGFLRFLIIFAIFSLAIATFYPFMAIFNLLVPFASASSTTRLSYAFSYCGVILSAFGMQVFIDKRQSICNFVKRCSKAIFICALMLATASSILVLQDGHLARWLNIKNCYIYTPIMIMFFTSGALALYVSRAFKIFPTVAILVALADLLPQFIIYNQAFPKPRLDKLERVVNFLKRDDELYRVTTSNVTINWWNWETYNFLLPYKIQNVEGYYMYFSNDYAHFIGASDKQLMVRANLDNLVSASARLTNLKYVLSDKPLDLPKDWYKLVYDDGISIYKNLKFIPRAFFATQYKVCKQDEIFKRLRDADLEPQKEVLLEEKPMFQNMDSIASSKIVFSNYSEDKVELKVATKQDGLLVLLDGYWPGWECDIDGKGTKIYRAYGTFRAVKLAKGEHKILFRYEPQSFKTGFWITIITSAVVILYFLLYRFIVQNAEH